MKDLGTALALVLVIEGVLYALFPDGMKRMIAQMLPCRPRCCAPPVSPPPASA